ncbi:hypothetical protein EDF64_106195 [Curtobacterium flaccumfaciens]|uniref:O-antigen ligase-like membrane protein n=1 Tax=Curtobacterium flaccumfaciens TaxID=2035 RepID=A0A4R6DH62_9MICO|nr:hypothetical protein [Curtobacterium flaccumfaciens]TDN44021.1 hypothetical protein EDF64_106195 [Curtobacterium flaccumfaciens]
MTVLGSLALVVALVGVMRRDPRWIAVALGFGAGIPASAGVSLGGFSAPVFTCVALVAGCAWSLDRTRVANSAAVTLLVAFVVWSIAVTGLGPWAFRGIPVLLPRLGIDHQVGAASQLAYSISNLAQVLYLVAALAAVLFLVRSGLATRALWIAAWTGTALSAFRGALRAVGVDVLSPVFDTLQISYSSAGDTRLRGVFSEPSELAAFSLAVAALAITTALTSTGRHRAGALVLAGLATVDLLASASGTAVAASAIVVLAMVVVLVLRYVGTGGRGTPWLVLGTIGVAVAVLAAGDRLLDPVLGIIEAKVGSQSFDSRTAADAIGLGVLRDTLGFGAGLGSNRSSSFAVSLLATVGLPGVILFGAVIAVLVVVAFRNRSTVPALVGLLALLVAKSIATPDLSTPLLWVSMAACAVAVERRRGSTPSAPALVARPAPGRTGRPLTVGR